LAAGDVPDIAVVKRSWLARLIPSGRIIALEQVLPPGLVDDLQPPARNSLTVDGHLFALPADGYCSVLYYNRDLVKEPPTTWEALRRCAQETARPAVYPIGDLPFLDTLWSAGGDVCNRQSCLLTSAAAQEALDFVLALRRDGLAHPQGLGYPMNALELFLVGKVAMTVASSEYLARAGRAAFSVGIAPVPGKAGPVAMQSDNVIVVFARYAAAKSAAIASVLDFLTGPDFAGPGSVPMRRTIAKASPPTPGLAMAYEHSRNTPLVAPWGSIEFELTRYLDLAYRWTDSQ
jgi:ABC-type glycerol-3-phosphate transport system substrate-binding protein